MPGPLIHIQGAQQILDEGGIPEPFEKAVRDNLWAYKLGALLVDLPLFDRFALKVALFLVKRPYPESPWSLALHYRGSASLAATLLDRARQTNRQALFSIVAGLLTHIAFDRVMHEPVEKAVRDHIRPTETPAQLHEAIENYQSLLWHRTHLGTNGLGTPLLKQSLVVSPNGRSALPIWLERDFRSSLKDVFGLEPESHEVRRWVRGICGYRDLLSTKVSEVSIRSSEKFERNRPWVKDVELEPAFDRGKELALLYLKAAASNTEATTGDLITAIGDGPLV